MNAADNVISDAIVAAQNSGGDQTHHLLGLNVQNALLVSTTVQSKKPLDPKVSSGKNTLVHLFTVTPELFKITQDISPISLAMMTT